MSKLDELCARLQRQYLDPNSTALPVVALHEAIQFALDKINRRLGSDFEIEGLANATKHTLPDDYLPVLLTGAGAHLMQFILQNHLGTYTNMGGEPALMQSVARYHDERFEWLLEGLRLDNMQKSVTLPYARWDWKEPLRWRI